MTKYDMPRLKDGFASRSGALGDRTTASTTGRTTSTGGSMADFDKAAYRQYLDGLDLTDAQAAQLMSVVWSIMRMFVEMDLPVDSCGQIVQGFIEPASGNSDSIK